MPKKSSKPQLSLETPAVNAGPTIGTPAVATEPDSPTVSDAAVSAPNPTPASFEESLERLGAIVEKLEDGDLPLEESLQLFEEGVKLARASQTRLDAAEKKVEELLSVDADGAPVVRQLEPES